MKTNALYDSALRAFLQRSEIKRAHMSNLIRAFAAFSCVLALGTAQAQGYPTKPVSLVVPYSAGGGPKRWRGQSRKACPPSGNSAFWSKKSPEPTSRSEPRISHKPPPKVTR